MPPETEPDVLQVATFGLDSEAPGPSKGARRFVFWGPPCSFLLGTVGKVLRAVQGLIYLYVHQPGQLLKGAFSPVHGFVFYPAMYP